MGQVVVDLPQNVFRSYHVEDSEFGEQLLRDLDENSNSEKESPTIIPPRRSSLKRDIDAAFGIWKDRSESAQEIAQKIRKRNNEMIPA